MKKIAVLLVSLAFMGLQVLHAQKQITGTVTSSEDGSTLPSVAVLVKGTSIGGVTNLDGVYQLNVPEDASVLVFSFVGMKKQEVEIQGRSVVNVVLEPESTELEAVVVVGYGTQTKESITGSVGVVAAEKTRQVPVTSVDKILQGNVAGVFVTSGSGQPGSFADVQIRGIGSINAGTSPLYVIDGVPVNSGDLSYQTTSANALSSLNPNDIASISVLKDASAGAIYGSRAANGVVLITTKRGKSGKAKFDLKTQFGFTTLSVDNYPMLNSQELLTLKREAVQNAGKSWQYATIGGEKNPNYLPDSLADINTNWFKQVTQTGYYKDYMLSASGGDEKTTFYTSAQYNSTQGAIVGQQFDRLSARLNIDHDSKKKISFSVNMAPSYTKGNWTYEGFAYESPMIAAQSISPMNPAYNKDGTVFVDFQENGGVNPMDIYHYTEKTNNTARFLGKGSVKYKILPTLTFQQDLSSDFNEMYEKDWRSPRSRYGKDEPTDKTVIRNVLITSTSMLSYNKVLNEVHNLDALVAFESQKYKRDFFEGRGQGATDDNRYLNAATSNLFVDETLREWAMMSYFGRGSYNYNGKYYLNASLRRDGSSRFGKNNQFANFWSVGSRWRVNRESFMENMKFVDELILRASYGTTGNSDLVDNLGVINYYAAYGVYENINYNSGTGTRPVRFANPDLRWEKSTTANIALEFGILKRLTGTIEYYNKKTTDMLFSVPLSYTTGFGTMMQNVGSMRNTGLEISLSSQNIKGEFQWNTDFNIAIPKNEILSLGGQDSVAAVSASDFLYRPRMRIIGQPITVFMPFDYAGVNPSNGNPMWYDKNGNLTERFTEARRVNLGSNQPKLMGSITNNLNYKGFSLSFMFYFVYDFMMMNQYRRYMEDDFADFSGNKSRVLLNRWQKPGDITDVPKPVLNNDTNGGAYGNSRWVTRGDFIRLKDLSLSYDFPEKITNRVKLEKVQVFVRGSNMWTRTIAPIIDPEVDQDGISTGNQPNSKTITFGINIGF